MAFGSETAQLVATLKLNDAFTGPLKNANRALSQFDAKLSNTQGRAFRAGQQIGTGIKNTVRIAVVAFGALTGLLALSVKEGQNATSVQLTYAKAIANSGRVSNAYVAILNTQQEALLNLAGVDDELIKTEQTRLIQMGLTGKQVAALTPLILDVSKATGKDLLTVTVAVGKAVQGNNTALARLGIILPKNKDATKAYAQTVDILNQRFGGTTKALSGQLDVRLAVLRERLSNVREVAGQQLLPVLTRIVDVVGQKLVPAFGDFLQKIMPAVLTQLNKFADLLQGGGAEAGLSRIFDTIKAVAPALEASAKITGQVIGTAVNLFRSLPPEIQNLAIAGLAINKLTGGLVTNIAGGLISAVLKQLVSGVVNVSGAVVNVMGGGVPSGGGLPTAVEDAAKVGGPSALVTAGIVGGLVAVPLTSIAIQLANLKGAETQTRDVFLAGKGASIRIPGVAPARGFVGPLGPLGHSSDDLAGIRTQSHIQTAADGLTHAAIRLISAASALKQAKLDVPKMLAATRAASIRRYGGHGLGESAVSATFNRDLLRSAASVAKTGWSTERKMNRLTQIEADAIAHGGKDAKRVAAEIRATKRTITGAIKANPAKLAVSVSTSLKTFINGRVIEANLSRYASTVTGHAIGTGPLI